MASVMLSFNVRLALGAALLALAACAKDATAPIKPASVSAANNGANGTVGTALATAPTFTVLDPSGNAMANVSVAVVVSGGGGSIVGAPTRTSAGATSVGTWTLGNTAGMNSLTVTVNGLAALLTITATGMPDVASKITVNTGGTQSAFGGAALASPISFKVADRFNNGIADQAVTFAIVAGGGSLSGPATATTGVGGLVSAPEWTLGKSTGTQQLHATSGAMVAVASANVSSDFSVDVRFFGAAMDPTIQAAFTAAAARIQALVTGDLQNFSVSQAPLELAGCGVTGIAALPIGEQIDDIRIYAQAKVIDGVGLVLGSAGPCYTRDGGSASGLTLIAVMNFDVADLQNLQTSNRLNSVILHEMLHAVGVGTLWSSKAQVSGANSPNSAFIGAHAVAGCLFHGGVAANQCGSGTVPVETIGGIGTRDVHWRENPSATGIGFRTELMTGFLSPAGIANPLSRITIGSLGDIGYVVNLLSADSYTVPSTLAASLSTIREAQGLGEFQLNETVLQPIASIDASGRITPLRQRP